MSESITPAEWERRKATLREAEAACVLPKGQRIKVDGKPGTVLATNGYCARVMIGDSPIEIVSVDRIEVVDGPVAPPPTWLRPGMLVECGCEPAVVRSIHGGRAYLRSLHDMSEINAGVTDLKPYVPQFEPGDRVVLATTGEVGTVSDCDHDPARGVVAIRLDGHRLAKFMAAAHLLAKLDEPS